MVLAVVVAVAVAASAVVDWVSLRALGLVREERPNTHQPSAHTNAGTEGLVARGVIGMPPVTSFAPTGGATLQQSQQAHPRNHTSSEKPVLLASTSRLPPRTGVIAASGVGSVRCPGSGSEEVVVL